MEKIDKEIILIAGMINATGRIFYWINNNKNVEIGDYAIVENMNGYDLIKIVGVVQTTQNNVIKFSNMHWENTKRVKLIIKKLTIEENQQ